METQSFPVYYHSYIEKVPEGELIELFDFSLKESLRSLVMIDDEKGNYAFAEGKWTIKDILQHLIDTERIFCYRALAFARGDQTNIPGYDHNAYVESAQANQRSMKSLLEELKRLRASTIDLFSNLSEDQMKLKGTANGQELSVKQLAYVIIGHEMHHLSVINQKYL